MKNLLNTFFTYLGFSLLFLGFVLITLSYGQFPNTFVSIALLIYSLMVLGLMNLIQLEDSF